MSRTDIDLDSLRTFMTSLILTLWPAAGLMNTESGGWYGSGVVLGGSLDVGICCCCLSVSTGTYNSCTSSGAAVVVVGLLDRWNFLCRCVGTTCSCCRTSCGGCWGTSFGGRTGCNSCGSRC